MNEKAGGAAGGSGPLSCEKSRTLLELAASGQFDVSVLDGVRLDRETAAAFVADLATLTSAVAESAGLVNSKKIGDALYVQALYEAGDDVLQAALVSEISGGQARLNR